MVTNLEGRNRRSDAQRNRAAIIEAALESLGNDPRASMADIAEAAGIGRVTLYGHFSSRKDLIDAAATQTMDNVEGELAPLNLDGDPQQALRLLVISSWKILTRVHGLLTAAEQELGLRRVRALHDVTLQRVRGLMERGQADGAFRTDQSPQWLTACFFAILHGASSEIRAGRLSECEATTALPDTIASLVSTPTTGPH